MSPPDSSHKREEMLMKDTVIREARDDEDRRGLPVLLCRLRARGQPLHPALHGSDRSDRLQAENDCRRRSFGHHGRNRFANFNFLARTYAAVRKPSRIVELTTIAGEPV
jgi:hypothetical protein